MRIFPKLCLGFGAVVATFALTGGLVLSNLRLMRSAGERVRECIALNEVALEYRHGALEAALGASQLASGNVVGEQRLREGLSAMERSREALQQHVHGEEATREYQEIVRVQRLTVAASERVVKEVRAKSSARLVQQELAFLSARADALNLRLEALFDDTREDLARTLEFSRAIEARVQRQTVGTLLGGVLVSLWVALAVARSIARPIARLDDGVRRIGDGDLEHSIAVTSSDEVGQLTTAFNRMTEGLRRAMSALDGRNRDMRVVLDHVNQGLLTMGREGLVSAERSAVVEQWLGAIGSDVTLWDHLTSIDEIFGASLKLGWGEVLEDFLPIEVTLDQLPKRLFFQNRHLEFEYRPILDGERVDKLLVVISDVSDRVLREQARVQEQETMAIFQAIQRDKHAFLDFFAEGAELVSSLGRFASSDLALAKRQIHTLKGNAGIFGIGSVAKACHDLESELAESNALPSEEQLARLAKRWDEFGELVRSLVDDSTTRIEIDDDEFAAILDALVRGTPRIEIARMVANWRMERIHNRLLRFGSQAQALAERLGKAPVEVEVDANGIRLPRDTFAEFWRAFTHVIRNALDHGLEPLDERRALGKGTPKLGLHTRIVDNEVSIEVSDDGRGIAWERIAEKARERNLPADSEQDLVHALFSDGVSTADSVTDISGRGVGMAALRDACAKLAGRILIDSQRGKGTRISFHFPLQVMFDETLVELSSVEIGASMPPREWKRSVSLRPPGA